MTVPLHRLSEEGEKSVAGRVRLLGKARAERADNQQSGKQGTSEWQLCFSLAQGCASEAVFVLELTFHCR